MIYPLNFITKKILKNSKNIIAASTQPILVVEKKQVFEPIKRHSCGEWPTGCSYWIP